MVRALDHIEIMLDDQHGVAVVHDALQHFQQLLHIVRMQAGGRLIQHEQRLAGRLALQLAGELHALGLAAGKRGRALSQLHIAQAHVLERLQLMADLVHAGEEVDGLFYAHFQHIINVLSFISDLQGLFIVALAAALFTRHIHIRQKVHGDAQDAIALAGLASPALHVEREAPFFISAQLGFRRLGKQLADIVKHAGVCRRIGTRRASDGILRDIDDLIDVLDAADLLMLARLDAQTPQGMLQPLGQDLIDQ